MTNPQPSQQAMGEFYKDYYHIFHERNKGVNDYYISKSRRLDKPRIDLLNKFVGKDKDYKKVLEVGCGVGQFLEQLGASGEWECSGIEPGKDSYDFCVASGLNVVNTGIEGFSTEEKFDVITTFHVFDHVRSPSLFLKKCNELLRTEGLIYIEISNFNRPNNVYSWFLQFPRLFSFTELTLSNCLKQHGFEIIFLKHDHNISIIGKKLNTKTSDFVRTDIDELVKEIHRVEKTQKLAHKLPEWPSFIKRFKKILIKTSV